MERVTFSGFLLGRMPEEWRAILPQGFSKREVYVFEGICKSIAEKAECRADYETEAGEDKDVEKC